MKRFIFKNDSSLLDYSLELVDYHSGTAVVDYVSAEDSIYIGSELPFNSLFFDVSVVNAQAATPSVSYWTGSQWAPMVDVLDETKVSGVSLAKSGYITWTTDKNSGWVRKDTDEISDLSSITIYDLFWLKLDFSADLDATTAFSFIGPKFCSDADLTGEHTLFGNTTFKANYESGKVDWEKEIVLASRLVVTDIKKKQAIISGDQLLDRRILIDATVSKCAEIIFTNLGDDYENDRNNAKAEYKNRLDLPNFAVDENADGRLNDSEKGVKLGGLYR